MATSIEERVRTLETEVAQLKRRLEQSPSPTEPWWKAVIGAFAGDAAFQEAERLGRQWRERENAKSLAKPKKAKGRKKKSKDVRS